MTRYILILAFSSLWMSSSHAQEIDADGDGLLSLREAQTAIPELTEEVFLMADTDGNGLLSQAELLSANERGLLPS
ncbi:EF-hand domain-containing protein [Palleronia pelagia]|uniref:EF hand n=1 Tax=Palleronia pelagia TaxID=387096 RepID=A0A1H8B608_9RHOB|nr:hypothetical protein [Palleronia pelagia]SEM77277.1 EF hand [Palleronia pelagia]